MDPLILIALIGVFGNVIVAAIGLIGIYISRQTAKAVDGLTTQRIEAETKLGVANAEVARHEGGDAARKEGVDIAKALLNTPLPTVDVNVVEAVPIEIKKT